jgi:hypothetical protein
LQERHKVRLADKNGAAITPDSLPKSKGINVMNESTIELEQTEDEAVTDEVSDEAIEAAASGTEGSITFTFSINIFYCRFC